MRPRSILPSALTALLLPVLACAAHASPSKPAAPPASPSWTPDPSDPRQALLAALASEVERSKRELKMRGHEAPYYVGASARGSELEEVAARYGAIVADQRRRDRRLQVDVRVGSYELDNTGGGEMFDFDAADTAYTAPREAPLDDDVQALRNAVWLQADEAYKRALSAYLKKRGKEIYRPDDPERPASFSREAPQVAIGPRLEAPFDREAWKAEARAQSLRLMRTPELFDSLVRVSADRQRRLLANTEGTRLVQESAMYGLQIQAWARAPDGMLLEQSRSFYGATEAELPRGADLSAKVDELVAELLAVRAAPVLDPYTGPAVLLPEAAGVLFHEAVGHRLEGERQNDDRDGRTFKGQVGKAILPPFLSIADDPTRARWGDTSLNGFYRFDDQGVPAQRTSLVEGGVLKGFLLSRAPVTGFARSNGHGRSMPGRDPVARMANLVVESSRAVSFEKLKALLVEEARRQGKPFGLIVRDVSGGNTDTTSYAYQAFKGQPRLVYKVDAQTGAQTLVRGVEVVGTPLTVIGKITATGDDAKVFNGYCGAESGFVPVSTVAPSVLVTEIELQRTRKDTGRPPILESPFAPAPAREKR